MTRFKLNFKIKPLRSAGYIKLSGALLKISARRLDLSVSLAARSFTRAFVASKQAGARYHEAHFANIPPLPKEF